MSQSEKVNQLDILFCEYPLNDINYIQFGVTPTTMGILCEVDTEMLQFHFH